MERLINNRWIKEMDERKGELLFTLIIFPTSFLPSSPLPLFLFPLVLLSFLSFLFSTLPTSFMLSYFCSSSSPPPHPSYSYCTYLPSFLSSSVPFLFIHPFPLLSFPVLSPLLCSHLFLLSLPVIVVF